MERISRQETVLNILPGMAIETAFEKTISFSVSPKPPLIIDSSCRFWGLIFVLASDCS
jgi:hypothetical protein